MNQLLRFILLTLAALLISDGCVQASSTNKINQYLIKNCDQSDFESNLKAAQQYLESLSGKSSLFGHDLTKDLKTFISLSRVERGEARCDAESRAILAANNDLAGDLIKQVQRKGDKFLTRYNNLVWGVFKKYALTCKAEHKERYRQVKKNMDKDLIFKVEAATRDMVFQHWDSEILPQISLENMDARRAQEALVFMVKKFKDENGKYVTLVNDESSGRGVLNRYKYIELFDKYIRQPCEYYVTELGPSVFEPAILDIQISNAIQDDTSNSLFEPILRYQVCSALIGKDSKSFLKQMINHSEKFLYKIE